MRRLYYCAAGKATKRETTWEIREEKPTFWRAYKGQKVTARRFLENVYWYVCSRGKYRVWIACDGEAVAHASYVVPKCGKFPFLKKGDFEIGPCLTEPEYRGQGIYPAVLARIVGCDASASTRANGYYMIVKDSNAPSVRGVAKAGFVVLPGEIKRDSLKRHAHIKPKDGGEIDKRWRYYNRAVVPDCEPRDEVDVSAIESGEIWRTVGKRALLARWTSDFDCARETEWWYTIKDDLYDISHLKSKKRYRIVQGRKNFDVRILDDLDRYAEKLFETQNAAFGSWPKKYRLNVDFEAFKRGVEKWKREKFLIFAAFLRNEENAAASGDEEILCGFCVAYKTGNCIEGAGQRVAPEYERLGVNFALVDAKMRYWENDLANGCYFSNGPRSTNHETAFNEWLIRYFGWRKAYCKLHIAYRPGVRLLVNLCYAFRKPLKRLDGIGAIHKINAIMLMEEIRRSQK